MEMYSNRRPQPIGFGVEIKFELGTYLNLLENKLELKLANKLELRQ